MLRLYRAGSVEIVSLVLFDAGVDGAENVLNGLQDKIVALLTEEASDGRLGFLAGDVLNVGVSDRK